MDEGVPFRRPGETPKQKPLRYAYGLRFFILSKTAACNNTQKYAEMPKQKHVGGYNRQTKNPQKTSFNALRTFKDERVDGDPSGIYPYVHRKVPTPLSPQHLLSLHIGLLMCLTRSQKQRTGLP